MIYVCAIAFLSSAVSAFSLGGAAVPITVCALLVFLPLLCATKRLITKFRYLSIIIFVFASSSRLYALAYRANAELGLFGALTLIVICSISSFYLAGKQESALYVPTPVFALAALLSLIAVCLSFSQASPYDDMRQITAYDCIFSVFLALSSALTLAVNTNVTRSECAQGCAAAMAIFAVFLLFPAADAELGFVSVPICVSQIALEFRALRILINRQAPE